MHLARLHKRAAFSGAGGLEDAESPGVPANTGPCPQVLLFRVPGTVAGLPTGELMRCTAQSPNLFFDPALIVLLKQPVKRHQWQGNSLLKRCHER